MAGVITDLKAQARILHRQIASEDPRAVDRVRTLAEFAGGDVHAVAARIRRRHCLATLALELGFRGWPHAVAVLRGTDTSDFGTLLYPSGAEVHWNIWSASYEGAAAIREDHGGYLLAYRRHYFITDRHFIATLGLDPDDPDWERIDRDWVKPTRPDARERLYRKLVQGRTRPNRTSRVRPLEG